MTLKRLVLWSILLLFLSGSTLAAIGFISGSVDEGPETGTETPIATETPEETPVTDPYKEEQEAFKYHPDDPKEQTLTIEYDGKKEDVNNTKLENALYQEVQEYRETHNMSPINYSDRLSSVSRSHSKDMAERDYFTHHTKNTSIYGVSRWDYMSNECTQDFGENLAFWAGPFQNIIYHGDNFEQKIAENMVNAWHNSSGHRKVLQNPNYDYAGVGVYMKTATPSESELLSGDGNQTHLIVLITYDTCAGENPDWDYGENKTQYHPNETRPENQTETSNPSDSSKSGSLTLWSP